MNYYAIRIDRNSINVIYYTLAVYVLMSVSEIVVRSHDGLTTSLAPTCRFYLGLCGRLHALRAKLRVKRWHGHGLRA